VSAVTPETIAAEPVVFETSARRGARRLARRVVIGVVVVGLGAGGVAVAIANPFSSPSPSNAGVVDNAAATSLARVTQRTLSSRTNVNGTLGYAGTYAVLGQMPGTITALASVGQRISRGGVMYAVNGEPVVLLYGATPAYRNLAMGMSGADVAELSANLVALGYLTLAQIKGTADEFTSSTRRAVKELQAAVGVLETGSLELGRVVFLASTIRVTAVSANLGAAASGPVLTATSTTRVVSISLNAAQQSQVKVGNRVTITLPNNRTTPGVVFAVGSVASAPTREGGAAAINVVVVPTDPAVTGSLDQAPVQVSIVTASVAGALVVPVAALLALAAGGYAIEVAGDDGSRHLEAVDLGLFDDDEGLVQVTGAGVAAGQRVVVPST
jgi:peptidoglycan hydrolase-like protein with peptidoglycan-binding domain